MGSASLSVAAAASVRSTQNVGKVPISRKKQPLILFQIISHRFVHGDLVQKNAETMYCLITFLVGPMAAIYLVWALGCYPPLGMYVIFSIYLNVRYPQKQLPLCLLNSWHGFVLPSKFHRDVCGKKHHTTGG